jgi:predicted AlkP superfamily pyrophosphatase or phosphodiesterase
MVDVAPTIAATLGLTPHPHGLGPTGQPRSEALLARQDGHQLEGFGSAEHARRALVILLDGVNANALYGAITRGLAPTLASLMERGTTFNHGVLASFPTATLANHTTANTGAHPGHTGILHHTWLDRDRDVVPDLLKTDEMFDPMRYLRPEVETLHEAIHRCRPDSFTTAAFEFCDRGADASSFGQIRTHGRPGLPDATELADATQRFVAESRAYAFMSAVDELATRQTVDWWTQREGNPIPTFSWLSLSLTDEAGHVYGPHSGAVDAAIIDSDRRVARVLNGIERTGALADTAVFVFADHGMQRCNPAHGGSWADTLLSTSLAVRDVGQGLLYSRHLPSSNIDHSGD